MGEECSPRAALHILLLNVQGELILLQLLYLGQPLHVLPNGSVPTVAGADAWGKQCAGIDFSRHENERLQCFLPGGQSRVGSALSVFFNRTLLRNAELHMKFNCLQAFLNGINFSITLSQYILQYLKKKFNYVAIKFYGFEGKRIFFFKYTFSSFFILQTFTIAKRKTLYKAIKLSKGKTFRINELYLRRVKIANKQT